MKSVSCHGLKYTALVLYADQLPTEDSKPESKGPRVVITVGNCILQNPSFAAAVAAAPHHSSIIGRTNINHYPFHHHHQNATTGSRGHHRPSTATTQPPQSTTFEPKPPHRATFPADSQRTAFTTHPQGRRHSSRTISIKQSAKKPPPGEVLAAAVAEAEVVRGGGEAGIDGPGREAERSLEMVTVERGGERKKWR
ncbi:hypothetical protein Droror1_Dr00011808 [Drosera rotundifolia]